MTLYYNVLAQRMLKPENNAGINTFWHPNWVHDRHDDRHDDRQKIEKKIMSNINHEQPPLNTNQIAEVINKPVYSRQEELPGKKDETDGFRVTSDAIMHCNNNLTPLEALTTGVIAKIPVVLAGLTLQLNLDSTIHPPEWVDEIKQVKKRVKITQCLLLQDTNVLFIKGLVCRTIDYTTRNVMNKDRSAGELRYWTVENPFKCTTEVRFNGVKPATVIPNSTCQIEFLKCEDRPEARFSHKEDLLTCDTSEFNHISTAFYNEMPFCELVGSKIVEVNEVKKGPLGKGLSNCIEGKMIINLTLKILQYQQVSIAPV